MRVAGEAAGHAGPSGVSFSGEIIVVRNGASACCLAALDGYISPRSWTLSFIKVKPNSRSRGLGSRDGLKTSASVSCL